MLQGKQEGDKLEITPELRLSYIRLIRSENIGVKTFQSLLALYGNVKEAIARVPELSLRGGKSKPIKLCSIEAAEKELSDCEQFGAKVILSCESRYPQYLLNTEDYPPVLTVKGRLEFLNAKQIAIVGARNASSNGCSFAYSLAEYLGKGEIAVTSGLARGIDTAAHKGALETGTIAVVAGGIDNIYPPENKILFEKLSERGIIVAELPYGSIPRGQNFPQRNRIISGMSLGTVVVEATYKSGSLITARFALSQNREVFAVPGFPLDPRCKGPNSLIKQGANIVTSFDDIIEGIDFAESFTNIANDAGAGKFTLPERREFLEHELEEARRNMLQVLSASPISIDRILTITDLPITLVYTVILELELAGKIERHPGNKISAIY
jgi:DNA processing protein